MPLKILIGIWMAGVIAAAFLYAPPAEGFAHPDAARIIFFHVPNAIVASIAFIMSAVYGIRYLKNRSMMDDAKSAVSAELGMVFAILATITGSLFAHIQWNSWWNWDPRETSIAVLLLIYAAYFALRSAVEGTEKRAALSAVYAVLALPAMAFLMFVLPRVMFSLHPANTLTSSSGLSNEYRMVLYPAILGFIGLFIWMFRVRTALAEIKLKMRRY
ncbi:MAG: cytochrome c biogenesis protein CcsA [Armatimonadota bacterium]